jgi:hypothetical protein
MIFPVSEGVGFLHILRRWLDNFPKSFCCRLADILDFQFNSTHRQRETLLCRVSFVSFRYERRSWDEGASLCCESRRSVILGPGLEQVNPINSPKNFQMKQITFHTSAS